MTDSLSTCNWCRKRVPSENTVLVTVRSGFMWPMCLDCAKKELKTKGTDAVLQLGDRDAEGKAGG